MTDFVPRPRTPLYFRGEYYPSILEASRKTGLSVDEIKWDVIGEINNSRRLTKAEIRAMKPTSTKPKPKKKKVVKDPNKPKGRYKTKVMAYGKIYDSMQSAADAYGVSRAVVWNRIHRGHPGWTYAE